MDVVSDFLPRMYLFSYNFEYAQIDIPKSSAN